MTARYDIIGNTYDTTRRADPYLTQRLLHHLNPQPKQRILDVACGSGNYTIALHDLGVDICGVDVSTKMIAAAYQKNKNIDWRIADATNLPFNNGEFAGAICTLATHHFDDMPEAFYEVRRILNQGRLIIFTATPEQMAGYWLNHYFPQMMARSIEQMPTLDATTAALTDADFEIITTEPYSIQPDLQDFFLHSGKHEPAIYLDPQVRSGISTFRLFAEDEELNRGCERLKQDIETGDVNDVCREFENELGDYLFIIAQTIG